MNAAPAYQAIGDLKVAANEYGALPWSGLVGALPDCFKGPLA